MRKTLGIAALMLAFCCPTLAGEIPNPPAPQPHGMTVEESVTANEDTTGATESLTQTALDVALSVLSLL
ncbi:MAG: hypothetical protein ACJ74Q_13500 [Pyrinomonadaceae bacterium]